ncbi:MAG TPA: hypothetical protein VH143_25770 [Kofleriaceae bacterium]|nr:hypothetical protein [Kofleriaceae bacterium]
MNPNVTGPILRLVDEAPPEVEVVVAPPPAPVIADEPAKSLPGRALALGLFAATIGGLAWGAEQGYYVLTDAWIAPLHLSPDNDSIGQLRLAHQHELDELARVDAEVTRLDGELGAIDASIAKLGEFRATANKTLAWQAEQSRVEATGIDETVKHLRKQYDAVAMLFARQQDVVAHAQADLAAGMVDRTQLDRELQTRDQLAVEMTDLDRQLSEAQYKGQETQSELRALRGGKSVGQMPEIAVGDEHTARIDIEIQRLDAEARGDRALRSVAVSSAASERALLHELEDRPLYRAMTAATDVAFVPYTQLDKLSKGARVVDCVWSVFSCHDVGRVEAVLPGEIVTQDPWGEMARGQYAVLKLDDPDAVHERVLRVRR